MRSTAEPPPGCRLDRSGSCSINTNKSSGSDLQLALRCLPRAPLPYDTSGSFPLRVASLFSCSCTEIQNNISELTAWISSQHESSRKCDGAHVRMKFPWCNSSTVSDLTVASLRRMETVKSSGDRRGINSRDRAHYSSH